MPQSHRDHGVAGGAHWLLDEELVARSRVRDTVAHLPALLRHDNAFEASSAYSADPGEPARSGFLLFLAALAGALFVYVLLHAAYVGGAGEDFSARADQDRRVVITASLAGEPRAGQIATIRAGVEAARPTDAATPRPRTVEPEKRPAATQPEQPKPPPPPDDLLPLPPPPAPLPDLLRAVPPVPEVLQLRLPSEPTLLDDL